VFCIVGVVVGAGATVHRGTPSWIAVIAGALSALPGVALGLLGLAFMRMEKRLSTSDVGQIVEHVKSACGENVA